MNTDLSGKVAIVTGGSKGIGLAVAEKMLEKGMKVIITGRSETSLMLAAESLNSSNLVTVVSDSGNFESNELVVKTAVKKFGKVDVIIANAGVGHFRDADKLSLEEWHETINTNLNGAFYILKAGVDALKDSKGYYLEPANPDFKIIRPKEDLKISAIVKAVVRKY